VGWLFGQLEDLESTVLQILLLRSNPFRFDFGLGPYVVDYRETWLLRVTAWIVSGWKGSAALAFARLNSTLRVRLEKSASML
jgi:hypothetical protein